MGKKIDESLIRHIASLSRLEINEEQIPSLIRQMGEIIEYFDKLNELETEGIEPLTHAVDLNNLLLEDSHIPSLSSESALSNAPEVVKNFFKVTKVLGDS